MFIYNIQTSPIWLIITTLILWLLFYFIFFKILKLSDTNWKRLEYIWLFTGFLGLIPTVIENKDSITSQELEQVKIQIQSNVPYFYSLLAGNSTCFKYVKSNYSPSDFEYRQYDQDLICQWSKTYRIEIDPVKKIPSHHLQLLKKESLPFKTSKMDQYIKEFNIEVLKINENIDKYNYLQSELDSSEWRNFADRGGILLLVIAFSIRLSIATRNVVLTKSKN